MLQLNHIGKNNNKNVSLAAAPETLARPETSKMAIKGPIMDNVVQKGERGFL